MPKTSHILVVDDQQAIRLMLDTGLSVNGFRVTCASSGREALERFETAPRGHFDAILSDIYMSDGNGLDLVSSLRAQDAGIPILLMTAQSSVEAAVEAIARGATDFIGKPFEVAAMVELLRRYLDARREAESEAEEDIANLDEHDLSRSGLVGRSAPMAMVYKLIAQAARSDVPVLILGESGTGKELVAKAIHDFSSRAGKPFLPLNCSGLSDSLLESELFGHTRGAFTGALAEREGLFEAARGGTIFLDELASTSPAFQASILRVLQSGEVRRVGSTHTRLTTARVIAASNAPMRELVSSGRFRADLFYRLSVLCIELAPLRERAGDVELLVSHFLRKFAAACGPGGTPPHLTREALHALRAHSFPGNVRELENAMRRAVGLSSNGLIPAGCLPPDIAPSTMEGRPADPSRDLIADRPSIEVLQRRYLQLVLDEAGWNRRRAATVLGVDRRTIQRLIARYQLSSLLEETGADSDDETASDAPEDSGE